MTHDELERAYASACDQLRFETTRAKKAEAKLAALTAKVEPGEVALRLAALERALGDALEYFEDREDISSKSENVPNDEMRLATSIRNALRGTKA